MVGRVRYGSGRDALVAAAVEIVAERGLRGLTFRAVAAQAGVNNSLVAHHFGKRDALLSAALEWTVERSIETTMLLDLESEERFTAALLESLKVAPNIQVFQYEMILEARRNELFRQPVKRLYDRYFEVTRSSLRHHVPSENLDAVARHVFSSLEGSVLQYLAGVDEGSIRAGLHDLWVTIAAPVDAGPLTS